MYNQGICLVLVISSKRRIGGEVVSIELTGPSCDLTIRRQACGALIPYFRRGSLALTDYTCNDYHCSTGYEPKNDYEDITCKYDYDDDECCNKGGFSTAMSPKAEVSSRSMDFISARDCPHAQNPSWSPFFYRLGICFNHEDLMIGCPFSHCSITGLRLHNALLFFKVANPSASTVNTCKYYDCSYRYEHKRDYEDIVCEDECDDRECCDRKRECDQYHVV